MCVFALRTEDLPGVVRTIVADTGCNFDVSATVAFARDTRCVGLWEGVGVAWDCYLRA